MGLSVKGISSTIQRLARTGDRTNKKALQILREGSRDIQELAKEYAPVDEGNLEDSIVRVEDRSGPRGQIAIFVGVDKSRLGIGYTRYGYEYDVRMHEDYSYELGPKSREKAARNGKKVGAGYLIRAVEELEDEIRLDIQKAIKGLIK